ncbi:DUF2800 domain-containing protein [Tissierella sp.]|uniref:DUF2800 domain-containing protein n=1 Tax=Tissierella sp. TaxID=41274 RepID=UPI0028AF1293|nr:DUF2800 domain-containing protein [Tissierella sp.]
MTKHALLSASSAERWLNCTPSARLSERYDDTTSTYAAEGTLAHSLGELQLQLALKSITKKKYNEELKKLKTDELFYEGMVDEVEDYVNYVLETYHEAVAKSKDAVIFLEERLDFSSYVPEGFGTGDCIIIADGEMEIIDLKFGKGVEVSPVNNSQLKLYALGAYEKYGFIYGIEKITMTIAQVRLNNISSWTITSSMLEEWAETELKPKAAVAFEGKGETVPGSWCTFCKVRQICKARAYMNKGLYNKFQKDPNLLNIEEIAEILGQASDIEKWAKEIKDYALDEALKGIRYPGFKLVEGRSNRKIEDEDALATVLLKEGYEEDKIYKPKTLEGITNQEKLIGKKKFTELAGELITKPPGTPTLVSEDDKRPELDSAEEDFF